LLQQIFLAAKGKSTKKVKEKESAKARVETETKSKKAETVTVTEVAEVTEPLEVVETEKVERVAAPVEEVRPEEIEQELRELKPKEAMKILVGLPRLTRFERARIIGARALQLSLGAPPLVAAGEGVTNAIMMAAYELEQKALPISLRRVLPDGKFQDIPIKWLLEN
jgi:DNA-directed RNA polymerase I, II, and III subunit RPABC2